MKKLYYLTYHQHLGQDTRYLAEGLILNDEELQQKSHFSIGEESYICSAVPLNDAEDIYYFIQDLIQRGKTTNMQTKRLQTLALREFLNGEPGDLYTVLCDQVQYGITRIQKQSAAGHTFYELDDHYADICRRNNASMLVEFAYLGYTVDYCFALYDELLNIELIFSDQKQYHNKSWRCDDE